MLLLLPHGILVTVLALALVVGLVWYIRHTEEV